MTIKLVDAYDFREEIKALFTEYTRMLIAEDGAFAEYLAIQNYDEEPDHLQEKYGRPDGRLYAMLLDTLPFLVNAVHLYRKYGFYEIESYNNSPMDTSVYMRLDL